MLAKLRSHGLSLQADGDRVLVSPAPTLTDELRTLIRDNKLALLEELNSEAALAIEARRWNVEERLLSNPELTFTFDIADAPLASEAGLPVSVVLAVRTAVGVVSGELHISRENFYPALVIRALHDPGRPS